MTLKSLLSICLACSFACSGFSHATIIDGYFKARIYADESDEGIFSGNLRGKKVSGHFWWDTALAPAADPNYPHATSYSGGPNDWLNFIFEIDGKKINVASKNGPSVDPSEAGQRVAINNTDSADKFYVGQSTIKGDFLGDIVQVFAGLYINGNTNFLTNDSLVQSFSWERDEQYLGVASIWDRGRVNGVEYSSYLEMYISKLTVIARTPVVVPEPSGIFLFGVGVLGLLVNRRKLRAST